MIRNLALFSLFFQISQAALDCTLSSPQKVADGLYLSQIMNPEEKTVTMELMYEGETWLGIGRSKGTAMIGADAVIGRVDIPNSSTNPGKYYLSAESDSGVNLVDNQSLMNASVTVDSNGYTTLRFTKYLDENGEHSITGSGDTWIYAIGSTNGDTSYPSTHARQGAFQLYLTPCKTVSDTSSGTVSSSNSTGSENTGGTVNNGGSTTEGESDDGSTGGITSLETEDDKVETLWKAHGYLMAIAWGVCIPMAIGCSILRNPLTKYFWKGSWYTLHRAFNLLGLILTFSGFIIALMAVKKAGDENFDNQHKKFGLVIVILVVLQVFFALIKPPAPQAAPAKSYPEAPSEFEDEAEADYEKETQVTAEKTMIRRLWEYKHRALGMVLIGLAWFNCYTGIETMEEDYGIKESTANVFWGVTGGVACTIALLGYVIRL